MLLNIVVKAACIAAKDSRPASSVLVRRLICSNGGMKVRKLSDDLHSIYAPESLVVACVVEFVDRSIY